MMPAMKRLLIMRHAKSSWSDDSLSDHDRPLNERGLRDAPRMGQRIAELGWSPNVVVSSDSERTRQTWALMASSFPGIDARFTRHLYMAGIDEIRDELETIDPSIETAMVLGHNPGFEEAVAALCGDDVTLTT